jgi:endonuclease G
METMHERAVNAAERAVNAERRAERCDLNELVKRLADDRLPTLPVRRSTAASPQVRDGRLVAEASDMVDAKRRFERVIAGNELADITYLALGLVASRSVGRVVIREDDRVVGYGTGFLVAPGVLMTNRHVLPDVATVAGSSVQFRYEKDVDGTELAADEFAFLDEPSPILYRDLDFALVAVAPTSRIGTTLATYAWLRLDPTPGKGVIGEYLTIIQHPNGERKQICVRENKLLHYDPNGPFLQYQTDTVGGSSGSPVFNNSWDVVGLHHSGVPRTRGRGKSKVWLTKDGKVWDPSMGEGAVDWYANEGIRISRILDYLLQIHPDDPVARAVLDAPKPPLPAQTPLAAPQASGTILQLSIPLPNGIPITNGIQTQAPPTTIWSAPRSSGNGRRSADVLTEAVAIDQSNYPKRNGYQSDFLGVGKLRVPLPKVKTQQSQVVKLGTRSELKYWNYSVVMNRRRRLAFFSVANVDPHLYKGKRPGDPWTVDPRIAAALGDDFQIDAAFYKKQAEFEADRTDNPFDQGHLSARENLQWGSTDAEALRNGVDSYHYTNCAPQHWQFNQPNLLNGLWRHLEEQAPILTGGARMCIINGPIFDAPRSKRNADDELVLQLQSARVADPTFGGVAVPKLYFKVIAWADDENRLRAVGFVVTQEAVLEAVDRLRWPTQERFVLTEAKGLSDAEIALYRVPIATIERKTGLDFGPLGNAEPPISNEALQLAASGRITSLDEVSPLF